MTGVTSLLGSCPRYKRSRDGNVIHAFDCRYGVHEWTLMEGIALNELAEHLTPYPWLRLGKCCLDSSRRNSHA